jgi:hypothetical protein
MRDLIAAGAPTPSEFHRVANVVPPPVPPVPSDPPLLEPGSVVFKTMTNPTTAGFKVGVGYSLLPEDRVCCWGGYGGSLVIIDVDRRITFAYVMNKMPPGGGSIAAALGERVKDIVNR